MGDRLPQLNTGRVLQPQPADDGRSFGHLHDPALPLLEHAVPFQIAVGPRHDLRIGHEFLSQSAVLRQLGPGLERPRRDVPPELAGDLLMNRHRRIVLNVDHGAVDNTAGARAIQPLLRLTDLPEAVCTVSNGERVPFFVCAGRW